MAPDTATETTAKDSSWRPVFDPALIERTRIATLRVAREWRAPAASAYENALRALMLAYTPLAWKPSARELSLRCLQVAIEGLTQAPDHARLHGGISGTAWLIAHTQQRLNGLDAPDLVESVDDYVNDLLAPHSWEGPFDLVDGLVGVGVYVLSRLPRPAACRAIVNVLEHLRALGQQADGAWGWHSDISWAPRAWGGLSGRRYWDTGMAHGIAGVAAFAATVILAGVAVADAESIVDDTVAWLTARQAPSAPFAVPAFVTETTRGPDAPGAWCYGRPGWACALALAGLARRRHDWLRASEDIALRALAPEQACAGPTLCHGAAGLSLMASRLAALTGSAALRRSAGTWGARALELLEETDGPLDPAAQTPNELLTGRIGVVLSLLAAATSEEPTWDRLLLLPGGAAPTTSLARVSS